ncbi:MAG: hypothetical protein RLZ72_214, partial [Actinomycetota bacterium]
MSFTTRVPEHSDLAELRNLIDSQESHFDPRHKPASPAWPAELLRGHVDTPHNLVWCDQTGIINAWATLQPDAQRRRLEIELFRVPNFPQIGVVWDWCLSVAEREFDGWVVWPTINYLDDEMARVFTSTGFSLLRRYFLLTRKLDNDDFPRLPEGVTIETVNSDDDFRDLHAAHQDAFSHHFGFMPRPADMWIEHYTNAEAADPNGRFVLRANGDLAGFVICSNDNAHENGGFVDVLGVRYAYHRRGFGEL